MTRHDQIQKSRLGRILVNRGYISEQQLDAALIAQAERGMMLGEVLVADGLISEKDLARVLRHQKNYRFATAAVTMIVAPLQPMISMAASPAALPLNNTRVELSEAQLGSLKGLQPLDDEELSGVNAQGFFPGAALQAMGIQALDNADGVAAGLQHKYNDEDENEQQNEEQIAGELADSVLTMAGIGPISDLIEADIRVEGLRYSTDRPNIELLEDGRIKFYMPQSIDLIAMENIRVKGNTSGPTMGSIYMSDISYGPRSSYTIGAK